MGDKMGCNCGGESSGMLSAAKRVVRAAVAGEAVVVDKQVHSHRLGICSECPDVIRYQTFKQIGDDIGGRDKCKACGCYIVLKSEFVTESCPLGKW